MEARPPRSAAAGDNWGQVGTPCIGQEVLVDCIGGDINRPVIVGALYNGEGQSDRGTASEQEGHHFDEALAMHDTGRAAHADKATPAARGGKGRQMLFVIGNPCLRPGAVGQRVSAYGYLAYAQPLQVKQLCGAS